MNLKNDSVETIVQNLSEVFKGFGVLPFTYKIQLKEGAHRLYIEHAEFLLH